MTTHKVFFGGKIVVHEFEAKEYIEAYGEENIWVIPDNVKGNIARVRNYILENAEEEIVVMLDDDYKAIGDFMGGKKRAFTKKEDIESMIINMAVMGLDM